jgi:tRNA A-37 threonylcarbamoyl transferase component Bud32
MQHERIEEACPCEDDIVAFVRGSLPLKATHSLEAHVARCVACRRLLSALAQVADVGSGQVADSVSPTLPVSSSAGELELQHGTRFGRYVVLDWLGSGGMGVVYSAYDSELNRKVALKVLGHEDTGSAGRTPIRDLLLREAQAMAQLAHPNVVTVYDVGSVADRVFIAMELVEGVTLAKWLVAEPRKPTEIIAMFLAAGNGLAAAHTAGLIHRDFKPDNVLIANDGRVRVTDFGLARAAPREPIDATSRGAADPERGASTTRSGVVGTLAYMAPEQYLGRPADPRADQFSFAVALHEALYGKRPGLPRPLAADDQAPDQLVVAPPRTGIPSKLRQALLRALRADPAERYPSMTGLLAALVPRPRRSRLSMIGALVVVATAVAFAGGYTIHLRHVAEQRTELVGRLRELAPELRTQLRSAHMLPHHDIRPARDEIQRVLRDVERQRSTTAAQDEIALIDFVLGEGYQALGDHERALTLLEAAWAGGLRGPRIEASLGDALAASYERRLDQLEDTVTSLHRDAEVRALEVRYRDPAIAHLHAALAGHAGSPAYLDALIAFHEHRLAEAGRSANAAFTESPMLYEAGVLEAKAHHRTARELLAADRSDEAKAEFATGRRIFEHVLEIARSDDEVWRGYAEMMLSQANALSNGDMPPELRDQAIGALRTVRQINPDSWQAVLSEAEIYEKQANFAIISSRDPGAYVDRVLALANEARAHGADVERVDSNVCLAHWERAVYQAAHGIDPRDGFAQAVAGCERAATAKPNADRYQALGVVYLSFASYLGGHGGDPTQSFEHSEHSFRAALAFNDDPLTHGSLGRLWTKLARYQSSHGQSPQHAVDNAVTEYDISVRRDAARLDAWTGISDALAARAEFQQQRQEDPRSTLIQARAALARGPKEAFVPATTSRMMIAMLEAEALLDRHADPTETVTQIRDDAQQLLRRLPDDGLSHRYWSQAELVAARWAIAHHEAAKPSLTHAAIEAERARRGDPRDALAWTTSAEVEQLRAVIARGSAVRPTIERGLVFIGTAIAIDPGLVRALRVRDALTRQANVLSPPRTPHGTGAPERQ